MKKVFVLAIILILTLTSCGSKKNTIIEMPAFDDSNNIHEMLDITPETDYGNIVAYSNEATYGIEQKNLMVTVKNNNVGKGFYLYSVPYLQVKKNNDWENIDYSEEKFVCQWLYIGEEGNTDLPNYTILTVPTEILENKPETGNYRFVIFTKDTILYAEFTIQ